MNEWLSARDEAGDGPGQAMVQGALGHEREHASSTKRGFSDARVARHDHQGFIAQPLEDSANVRVSPKKECSMLNVKGPESAVGISGGQRNRAVGGCDLLQGI